MSPCHQENLACSRTTITNMDGSAVLDVIPGMEPIGDRANTWEYYFIDQVRCR